MSPEETLRWTASQIPPLLKGLWLVEWSYRRLAFRAVEAHDQVTINMVHAIDNVQNGDWQLLGIFNSQKEAEDFRDLFRLYWAYIKANSPNQ